MTQSIEQVMAQLLVMEQSEDLQLIRYMAHHCQELLWEPREQLRISVGKRS